MESAPHRFDAGRWSVWRECVLRSAGLAIELLEPLRGSPAPAVLQRLLELPRFREAITWQNPGFARSGLAWLARHPDRRNWRARANQRTALSYLQRFAARNDTVGSFGPSVWAELTPDGPPLSLRVGPRFVDQRTVAWELWALSAFARRFGIVLPPAVHPSSLPMAQLAGAAGPEARDGWRSLEEVSRRLASAAGDPDRLETTMQELEREFTRVTGRAPSREHGRQQAARTLIREDCRRDVALRVGPAIWQRVVPALDWLLVAQRWVTAHAGAITTARLEAAFDQCAIRGRASLATFLPLAGRILEGLGAPRHPEVAALTHRTREQVLGFLELGPGERRVTREAAALLRAAAAAFGEARPGWPSARYHCPDVLLAAPSAEAAARGEGVPILGELHTAKNTVDTALFCERHPEPERIAAAAQADLGIVRVRPVLEPDAPNGTALAVAPGDMLLDPARRDTTGSLLAPRDLELQRSERGIIVRTLDGKKEWALLELFDVFMGAFGAMLPYLDYMPRLTVDGMVVARESWRLSGEALAFAREPSAQARHNAVRRLVERLQAPRHVFVRTSREPKPFYIDLESEPFVELLAWLGRHAEWVQLTEMLPEPRDCWLVDSSGARYTSELRMVLVDPS